MKIFAAICMRICFKSLSLGGGHSSAVERRIRDGKVAGSSPRTSGGTVFFSRVNVFVLTLTAVSVPPPCYRSSV